MLSVVEHLVKHDPEMSALIISGAPMLQAFRMSEVIDYVKLPCLRRTTGTHPPRYAPAPVGYWRQVDKCHIWDKFPDIRRMSKNGMISNLYSAGCVVGSLDTSAKRFTDVARVPVTTDGSTVFEGGVATDLGLNVKVEVEGDLDANGTIVATKVDIRRSKAVRIAADIDSVDAAANSFVVLGITVTTDPLTRFEDKSDADVEPLNISDLNAGDHMEVRGAEFPAGSEEVLATIAEREDPDTESELQGFVAANAISANEIEFEAEQ